MLAVEARHQLFDIYLLASHYLLKIYSKIYFLNTKYFANVSFSHCNSLLLSLAFTVFSNFCNPDDPMSAFCVITLYVDRNYITTRKSRELISICVIVIIILKTFVTLTSTISELLIILKNELNIWKGKNKKLHSPNSFLPT